MLRSTKELNGYIIKALDGGMGTVEDLFVDGCSWHVRYLVVRTGSWLDSRRVLLVPQVAGRPDWEHQFVPVSLTKDEVRSSPPYDTQIPVSREYEAKLHTHYAWTPYFAAGVPVQGIVVPTPSPSPPPSADNNDKRGDIESVNHLRSLNELTGYGVMARDGEFGVIDDFIGDVDCWQLRYFVVDTGGWFSGKRVLVACDWIERPDWTKRLMHVNLDRNAIEHAPLYDPTAPVNRQVEVHVYDYHGRPKYWE